MWARPLFPRAGLGSLAVSFYLSSPFVQGIGSVDDMEHSV